MHAAEALTLAGHGPGGARRAGEADRDRRPEAVRAGPRGGPRRRPDEARRSCSRSSTSPARTATRTPPRACSRWPRSATARSCGPRSPQDADLRLKLMAAAALARCGHPTALDAVRKRLTDPDVEIRKVAAWVLGQLGDSVRRGADPRPGWTKETDPLAKAYFVHALALLGDADGRKALGANLDVVRRGREDLRRRVRRVLPGSPRSATRSSSCSTTRRSTSASGPRSRSSSCRCRPTRSGCRPRPGDRTSSATCTRRRTQNPRYSEGSVAVLTDGTLLYATTEFVGGAARRRDRPDRRPRVPRRRPHLGRAPRPSGERRQAERDVRHPPPAEAERDRRAARPVLPRQERPDRPEGVPARVRPTRRRRSASRSASPTGPATTS